MTKKLVVDASMLAKSQVAAFTRKDGVMVQAHDNGKQAAAPKPAAGAHPKGFSAGQTVFVKHPETGKKTIAKYQGAKDGKSVVQHDKLGTLHVDHEHVTPARGVPQRADPAASRAAGDDVRAAMAANSTKTGGYSVAPFKHGGHQIKEPGGKHHIVLHDKGVADRHAGALNHVAQSGKDAHMNEVAHAAAKKHLHLDSFDEVGSDREDFVDTGKGGLKAALHHAYDAGAGHSKGGAHRDAVVSEAAKHFAHFDSLEQAGRDHEDFKDVSKGSLKHALKHAYASGSQKAQAKPKLKVKASIGQ